MRGALLALAERPKISGEALEIIVGHATFCALLRRELLSIFSSVYAFIYGHYHDYVAPWREVKEELRAFANAI